MVSPNRQKFLRENKKKIFASGYNCKASLGCFPHVGSGSGQYLTLATCQADCQSSLSREITINGDVNDIRGAIEQAERQGVISEYQLEQADPEIVNAIRLLTPTPDNPDPGQKLKCKKSCSSNRKGGKCVLGGCFTLKGFPPKKFSWTWEI
jgi:hypothetical protein